MTIWFLDTWIIANTAIANTFRAELMTLIQRNWAFRVCCWFGFRLSTVCWWRFGFGYWLYWNCMQLRILLFLARGFGKTSVRYGKHSIRFSGPYLWSRLSATYKKRLAISNFRNSIREKDLTVLMKDACSIFSHMYYLTPVTLFRHLSINYHVSYFYLFSNYSCLYCIILHL